MNDLERDLQEVLHEDARRVPTPTSAPEGLRRSVRRRQAVFGSVVGLSALAIVAGIVAGASMLLPFESARPAGGGPMTTGTLNGITITHPAAWYLIDPDEAGLNWPRSRPRFLGSSSRCHRSARATRSAVPGMADGEPPTFLMTVQEAAAGARRRRVRRWPAALEPMNLGAAGVGLLSRLGVPARRLDDRGSDVRGSGRGRAPMRATTTERLCSRPSHR